MRRSILLLTLFELWRPGLSGAAAEGISRRDGERELPVIRKYLDAAHLREGAWRGRDVEVEVEAKLPRLKKTGTLVTLRQSSCDGQVTYHTRSYSGDAGIKREIIARYLAAESDGPEGGSAAITPANYEFRLKATAGRDAQRVYIYQIKPRKKRVGLFRGELWIHAETGMPVREAGQFVKLPSVFLRRARFVRNYELIDGIATPQSIESSVETRLAGSVKIQVRFQRSPQERGGGCGIGGNDAR